MILRATPPGFTSRSVASQGHEESKSCGTRTGRPEGVDVKKRTQQRSRRAVCGLWLALSSLESLEGWR
ncbi:conserved hypothetical protein [Coccidioides posadasii str. Silveira]|uniref:Uncharacterized protein n=1 Tax=Coccidioides posadasii (strain RMSCC 757 / Silveira) TaxID=443226 RepID=E9DIS6_COCPS|nr:conserved hypothetical protein [Coccidioides posadasii str. Silveira]